MGSLNTLRFDAPVLSHSIAGALAGGAVGVEAYKWVRGIREATGAVFVGSIATGMVVGRWGCLFAGLPDQTFGVVANLPWSVDLGDGVPRHPVQIYESAAMAVFLAVWLVALARRATWPVRHGFQVLCIWYGTQRFAWEFLKPYPKLLGPFNLFHILCAGLVLYGCVFIFNDWARRRAILVSGADHQPV
jgi:phosphatidylglycerol---prolipoprotein diacylglyceryl transferase